MSSAAPSPGSFHTTRWSLVFQAGQKDSPQQQAALAALCQAYWYPLYAFVRRGGKPPADAEDLTQQFFARLLERNFLDRADRNKGRFRSFLLAAMKHFLADEHDRATAQKRGGGRSVVSLDASAAEERYRLEPVDRLTPERLFARRWALTVLEQTLARLRREYESAGKGALFDRLKAGLTGQSDAAGYAAVAAALGSTEGAIKVAAHRLRQRYRALLRAEIAATVSSDDEVEDEIGELLLALGE